MGARGDVGSPGQYSPPHSPVPAGGGAHGEPGVPVSQHRHPACCARGWQDPTPPGAGVGRGSCVPPQCL